MEYKNIFAQQIKISKHALLSFVLFALSTSVCFSNVKIVSISSNPNYLSTQIVFNLTQKTNVGAYCDQSSNCFSLYFEEMAQSDVDTQIADQINHLKSLNLFDDVQITSDTVNKKLFINFHSKKPLIVQVRKIEANTAHRIFLDVFQNTNPIPQNIRDKNICIVLDPGHGGNATETSLGASYYGTNEKTINLELAILVAQKLKENGFNNVQLTRTVDKDVALEERVTFAYQNNAAIFVSLHANAVGNPQMRQTTHGIETYYYKFQPEENSFFFLNTPPNEGFIAALTDHRKMVSESSRILAIAIQKSLANSTGALDRGVKDGKYFVIAQGQITAVLAEVGFLSNEEEHKKLIDPVYREKLATAICSGIISFTRMVRYTNPAHPEFEQSESIEGSTQSLY